MSAGGAVGGFVRNSASLVKLSHSVFALPFALLSLLVATDGRPSLRLLGLVVAAVVCARTAAMAWNRWADRAIDAANPRTVGREIPRGAMSAGSVLALALGSVAAFLFVCWLLGPVCLAMGFPVVAWLLLYSHAKRFTWLCHLWLGIALGLSPVAAAVAAQGTLAAAWGGPALLGAAVALWVAGFDVLYACQDEGFDRQHGLHSIPAAFGARGARWCSRLLHAGAFVLLVAYGTVAGLGTGWTVGLALAAGLLGWQHWLLRSGDLTRIDAAFFTANGLLSAAMFAAACLDLYAW
ncbi:MAG: hypothetical protein RL148_2242 [Planctomycetota bacterium]|jgi:4-hydroxybenzoate polyprenyltransferase